MSKKLSILGFLVLVIGIAFTFNVQSFIETHKKVESKEFAKPEICLGSAVVLYHKTMNALFNYKLELITSGDPKKYVDTLPEIDEQTGQRKKCEANNITTYCVAQEALENYEALLKALKVHQERINDITASDNKVNPTIGQELGVYAQRQQFIKQESENAKKTLDLALATYHEFRTAYPLHKKFQKTLSLLEKYRDAMANFRRTVNWYQYKFIDVTTTQCS